MFSEADFVRAMFAFMLIVAVVSIAGWECGKFIVHHIHVVWSWL